MTYFIIILVVFLLTFLSKMIVIVPQGYHYVCERFGQYKTTLTPGIQFISPFIENIRQKVSLMETVLQVPSQDVITKDNAVVQTDGIVFFRILEPSKAVYGVENLRQAILNLSMTSLRTVMGSMDLDELLSHREAINAKLLQVIDEATSPWGTKVTRVEIKDIKPPQDLVNSMARQMKAERDKRANILEAEGLRQAAILKSEGEKQSAILTAEGQKMATIVEAEGKRIAAEKEAEIKERLAIAEANAIKSVAESSNDKTMRYFMSLKYVESLKEMASSPNHKVLFLPLEAQQSFAPLLALLETIKKDKE